MEWVLGVSHHFRSSSVGVASPGHAKCSSQAHVHARCSDRVAMSRYDKLSKMRWQKVVTFETPSVVTGEAVPQPEPPPANAGERAPEHPTANVDEAAPRDGQPEFPEPSRQVPGYPEQKCQVPSRYDSADDSDCPDHSVAGDTVASEADGDAYGIASLRNGRIAPKKPVHGHPGLTRSAKASNEHEVGNFALFFGNWGPAGTGNSKRNSAEKKLRSQTRDRQILKCPGMVVVLVEATNYVEELLEMAPSQGILGADGLQARPTHEHFVVRGAEESAVLIAARKDNTISLENLEYIVHDDHRYSEDGKDKMARTRILICRVEFKQNVGHLGKSVVVAGVHGHYRTMKMKWPKVWSEVFDLLARKMQQWDVRFLAGDFNMSLTEVPKQLRSRGIQCDCVAWYPYMHDLGGLGRDLGFDSCGIFYIGGAVKIKQPWSFDKIDALSSVEGNPMKLDVYQGENTPGKDWHSYRSPALDGKKEEKNLRQRLHDLLELSTTAQELDRLERQRRLYCPYLRLKHKTLDQQEWLVEGRHIHKGAHFPLCVWTHNASGRSFEASERRSGRRTTHGHTRSSPENSSTGLPRRTCIAHYGQPEQDQDQGTGSGPSSSSASRPAVAETNIGWNDRKDWKDNCWSHTRNHATAAWKDDCWSHTGNHAPAAWNDEPEKTIPWRRW